MIMMILRFASSSYVVSESIIYDDKQKCLFGLIFLCLYIFISELCTHWGHTHITLNKYNNFHSVQAATRLQSDICTMQIYG